MKLGSFKGDALQKLFLKTKHMEKNKSRCLEKNHQHYWSKSFLNNKKCIEFNVFSFIYLVNLKVSSSFIRGRTI